MKTTLTVEESQRLIELGVDPKMAKGVCLDFNGTYAYISGEETKTVVDWVNMEYYTEQPVIFTLTDLLSILPKEIDGYELNMSANKCEYFVSYILWDTMDEGDYIKDILSFKQFSAPELIDALNQLLIWCLEQKNHQKKGGLIWHL